MRVKGKIYRAIVQSTLLYGAEAWTVYRRQVKRLHAFMMRHLRSIMRITWMDKVTNKEILERTGLPSIEDLLIRKNLRWTGHLMRMSPDRLRKQVFYSQLSSGQIKRGRPRLRFKDTIKRNLELRDIKMCKPYSTRPRKEDIMVDGNKLHCVLEFTYLGSTISSNGCINDEIQRRVAKVSAPFGRLRSRLWNNHHVLKSRYTMQSCCTPSFTEPRPRQCTYDR